MNDLNRRDFLKVTGTAAAVLGITEFPTRLLAGVDEIDNPLGVYPNRNWEEIYRDQYRFDSTFKYVCSPNDTHACRVEAFVRNGIVMRLEQPYDVHRYTDIFGNKATANWHPRMCAKGNSLHRRVYGPFRLRYPLIREGWKQWADDGFPELTDDARSKYKFDARGKDRFLRASWDDAFKYLAKGLVAIARRYSGPEGAELLKRQGYEPEMIEEMAGAGTRTLKFRGGMGLLGVIGKYGMYRLAQTMALLDVKVRGVDETKARGGRLWSNYTWHGDQAPGHPFVHGLQNSEVDFNDLRFSKLIVQCGKNLVENKMPESHFFIECMERGAKIVVITPEYSPPSTKADYWIPIRPASDAALFLGITKILIDEKKYDERFVKRFTDFPLLVRTDTLKRLKPQDFIADYQPRDLSQGPSMTKHGLTPEQRVKVGDFVVWDTKKNQPVPLTRDDVGDQFEQLGIEPAIEGKFEVKLVGGTSVEVMPLFEMYKLHLKDYDLDSVADMTRAPKDLIRQLADDFATIKPAAIHSGEGIHHWFHATEVNRSMYLPLMLTGNIGVPGSGAHGWAGNYKAAVFQGSSWSGPGFKGWVAEDPFHPNLDENADGKEIHAHGYCKDEEPAYWNHGDRMLVVDTPKFGRKIFTGKTHMPTPTKAMVFTNVNLINNAKHAYDMIKNVDPKVELIVSVDIEMTASIEYADFALAANSWMESETHGVVLESVPANLEGRDQAAVRHAGRRRDPRRHRVGLGRRDRRPALQGFLEVRARRPAGNLHPAAARCVDDHARLHVQGHHGRQVRRAGRVPYAVPYIPAAPVLGAGPREPAVLHADRPHAGVQRRARDHRIRRKFHRAPRKPRGDAVPAKRHRQLEPVHPPGRLRHPARGDGARRANDSQHQAAVGRSEADEESALGERFPVLLPNSEDAAPRSLVVEHVRLVDDLGLELRRPVPHGQAIARRRRAPASHQPAGGPRPGHRRRRLRVR
jgi:nitrate reductase alpha subunit